MRCRCRGRAWSILLRPRSSQGRSSSATVRSTTATSVGPSASSRCRTRRSSALRVAADSCRSNAAANVSMNDGEAIRSRSAHVHVPARSVSGTRLRATRLQPPAQVAGERGAGRRRAGVDPVAVDLPSAHVRRIEHRLAHVLGVPLRMGDRGRDPGLVQQAGDVLDGRLDETLAGGRREELRAVQHRLHPRRDVEVVGHEHVTEGVDDRRRRAPGRRTPPTASC